MARSTTARTTDTTTDTTPAATAETTVAPTVELLAPTTLLTDVNVRHDPRLDPAFVASVKEHGVLVPIVAVRTPDGGVRVRFGHRRTLAAIEANRPVVPVVIVADEAGDPAAGTAAQVQRIVGQWAENEHRTGLTNAERVDALAQLAAFGVSAAQIAKRTKAPRREVDAALAVAGSDLAKAAAARYDFLDLAQACVLAEFDSDKDAIAALLAAAKDGRFDHVAQRLRDDRAEQARRAELAEQLMTAGTLVIATPRHGETARALDLLDGPDGNTLTVEAHRDCPGHAAFVTLMHGYLHPDTGQPLAEDDPLRDVTLDDEDDDLDPDAGDEQTAGPASELADLPRPRWGSYVGVRYTCTDPAAHGHADRYAVRHRPAKRKAADMDDTERETARQERRTVVENNKSWASAETVRRAWLRDFAARKSAPKGAAAFIAAALATDADLLAGIGGNHLAADLLGCTEGGYGRNSALRDLTTQAGEARALLIALIQVLAAYEDRTDRDDWRRHRAHTARYLGYLAACGYVLAEVEQLACGTTASADA